MNNDSRLCDKCGLLPQTGSKPKPPCKPKCKKRCKKDCCENDFVFRKVVIPAALGDDVNGKDTPANGAYVNAYVEYEANGAQYMYDSYGVYTKLEVKSQEGITDFDELSGRPKYAGNPMTSATDIPDVMSAPTFKPFPDGVVTDGTTQQFMNSILALDPTVGTAYMGTVELSDMPAGLIQEEVEVYVYNSYTIYCIMRSTDVAPYSWWCASYNYQGWQPIGSGGGMTIFYANSQETGATRHIYKDDHFTEEASVQDLLDANEEGPITLRITIYPNADGVFSDAYIQNTYVGENDYQFLFLDERTYREYTASTTSDTTFYYFSNVIQTQLTAGSNIQINGTTISATDTTYSDFVGTDGTATGTAGLVPAPATTDAGKYLKADGTWDSVQAGPTVVQTTGTSTTDVMSQNATTGIVFADPSYQKKIRIGSGSEVDSTDYPLAIGYNAKANGRGAIAIGSYLSSETVRTKATHELSIAIGGNTQATNYNAIAIGHYSRASGQNSVAIGIASEATQKGEFNIGASRDPGRGFNNSNYRLLSGVYDPQSAHDAATKNYTDNLVINYSALNGASAPTTATEAKYVGQLYLDTTNSDMYYCSAITAQGTDPETYTYTWNTIGGGPTVVQTIGASTADVMSQDAVCGQLYGKNSGNYNKSSVMIGSGGRSNFKTGIYIGNWYDNSSYLGNSYNIIIGDGSASSGSESPRIGYSVYRGIAIGGQTRVDNSGSIALGFMSVSNREGELSVGNGSSGSYITRYIANVKDPSLAQDAATKNYVDSIYPVGAVFTSTSATAPTIAGGTWTEIGTQTIGSSTVHYYERTA